ncbi:MAG TPA: hypothetical protein PKI01_11495 [Bacteroidales bacterium]|nr:hypothetical protein [Bacteroidales bacterium]
MKTLKLLAMLLFMVAIAVSCKKEEGPAGPQGPAGTNGTDGNANVTVYGFGETLLNSGNSYWVSFEPAGLTAGMIDSSLFLTYYLPSGGGYPWYPTGCIGPDGAYQTKLMLYNSFQISVDVRLYNPDGTAYSGTDVTWDSVRIFVVPATTFRRAEADNVDFNNYDQVKNYFPEK